MSTIVLERVNRMLTSVDALGLKPETTLAIFAASFVIAAKSFALDKDTALAMIAGTYDEIANEELTLTTGAMQ